MKTKIYVPLLIVVILSIGCQGNKVEQVCSGIKSITKGCKELNSAVRLSGLEEGSVEDEITSIEKIQSVPLPAYLWDTQRVVW